MAKIVAELTGVNTVTINNPRASNAKANIRHDDGVPVKKSPNKGIIGLNKESEYRTLLNLLEQETSALTNAIPSKSKTLRAERTFRYGAKFKNR